MKKNILDSNLLRCFLSILDHRKLTAAATELCITQPALSKSLRRLEKELGVTLFQRTPSGMVPTTYGLTLGRRAHQILLESTGARNEIQLMLEGGYGSIVIGTGPMWSVHAFPAVIAGFIKNQPRTHIKIVSGVLDTLLPRLLKSEIDLVIASLNFPDHPDLIKEHIADTQHVIMASKNHPLASREYVNPRDLLDFPFVGFVDDYAGLARMEQFFATHGIPSPGLTVECNSLETVFSLMSEGNFLASLASPILPRGEHSGLVRINLRGTFWRFSVGAIYRRNSPQSVLLTSLLHAIRTQLTKPLAERATKADTADKAAKSKAAANTPGENGT
jgi:DNA-binding transcriptional LysR family regulator